LQKSPVKEIIFCKRDYHFMEPTNRSHPIVVIVCVYVCLSVCLSVFVLCVCCVCAVSMSLSLSLCPSVFLFLRLPVSLPLRLCLAVSLPVCVYVRLCVRARVHHDARATSLCSIHIFDPSFSGGCRLKRDCMMQYRVRRVFVLQRQRRLSNQRHTIHLPFSH